MRVLLQKILPSHLETNSHLKKGRQKSRGQSLVEIALTLPVLLILFSGMVEFGFMLNYYLSLLDATRYAARHYSGKNPFITPSLNLADDQTFYYFYDNATDPANPVDYGAAYDVWSQLQPRDSSDNARKVGLNPNTDDVIVSVYSVDKTGAINPYPLSAYYPSPVGAGSPFIHGSGHCPSSDPDVNDGKFHLYCNVKGTFNSATLLSQIVSGSPCQGFLVVEVAYQYHQILGLPWTELTIGSPILHAYTVMPLPAAAPGYDSLLTGSC